MPAEAAPAPEAQDPMIQLVEAAMVALESQDPNMAMQVCQMLVELVGGAQGAAPQGQPVFRKGGKLVRK